jgi:hypothetical protein
VTSTRDVEEIESTEVSYWNAAMREKAAGYCHS